MASETTGRKRYICSFVKEVDGEFKPNVVVIPASNSLIARALLCSTYGVLNTILIDPQANNEAGIKTIRLSETNTYELKEDEIDD